jgi:PKD repeat protein
VDGKPLLPSETVSSGTSVTFSSAMTQANALSVEWDFGDGKTETVSTDEYQHTEVSHAFVRGGELTVTETIHTDDLATPTIVKQAKVSVSNVAVPPTAVLEGPLELTLGVAQRGRLVYLEDGGLEVQGGQAGGEAVALASFDGSASFDANPPGSNKIASYHWIFGDGSSETTETPTVTHPYLKAGSYKVELTITDELGLTSEPSALGVKVNPAPAPAPEVVRQPVTSALLPPPVPPSPVSAPALTPTAPSPVVGLAGTRLAAGRGGAVQLVITCPAGETNCAGTVTLRTLHPVAIRAARARTRSRKPSAAVLMLAGGKFTVAGGRQLSLTLHLTARARALLAHMHSVQVRATLAAHDSAGATHTTMLTIELRAPGRL